MRTYLKTLLVASTLVGGLAAAPVLYAHDSNGSSGPTMGQVQSDPASQSTNRGSFSLIDHMRRPVTDRDFLGKFMLVFFGYTHCPDICPTDLQIMSDALDILGEASERVQPIFITIDPKRDTPEVMGEYVRNFHPRLVGLTGSPEQVAAAAKVYRVRSMKFFPLMRGEDDESDDEASKHEENSQYLMDHSASIYLVGPDGGGLSLYPHGMTPDQIAEDVRRFIDSRP